MPKCRTFPVKFVVTQLVKKYLTLLEPEVFYTVHEIPSLNSTFN